MGAYTTVSPFAFSFVQHYCTSTWSISFLFLNIKIVATVTDKSSSDQWFNSVSHCFKTKQPFCELSTHKVHKSVGPAQFKPALIIHSWLLFDSNVQLRSIQSGIIEPKS